MVLSPREKPNIYVITNKEEYFESVKKKIKEFLEKYGFDLNKVNEYFITNEDIKNTQLRIFIENIESISSKDRLEKILGGVSLQNGIYIIVFNHNFNDDPIFIIETYEYVFIAPIALITYAKKIPIIGGVIIKPNNIESLDEYLLDLFKKVY